MEVVNVVCVEVITFRVDVGSEDNPPQAAVERAINKKNIHIIALSQYDRWTTFVMTDRV